MLSFKLKQSIKAPCYLSDSTLLSLYHSHDKYGNKFFPLDFPSTKRNRNKRKKLSSLEGKKASVRHLISIYNKHFSLYLKSPFHDFLLAISTFYFIFLMIQKLNSYHAVCNLFYVMFCSHFKIFVDHFSLGESLFC